MIGIRTDANSIIATGHMMRCLTIAKAIVESGENVIFFLADKESYSLFEANVPVKEIKAIVMETDYRDMDGELDILEKCIKDMNITSLLVDSYSVTHEYFERLKNICPVTYIDDLHKDDYPVNCIINYSGYSKKMGYTEGYKDVFGYNNEKTRLLLGLQYAPLREQFYRSECDNDECQDDSFSRDGLHVLVSTGGADMRGMLIPILKSIDSRNWCEKITWHLVVGSFSDNYEEVIAYIKDRENVIVHKAVKNMAYLMHRCDIAIMAAGTMLTECAASGLPTVFFQVADNQQYNVQYWGQTEGMTFAGDVSNETSDRAEVADKICQEVEKLTLDRDFLKRLSKELRMITDGRGALRIAEALIGEI